MYKKLAEVIIHGYPKNMEFDTVSDNDTMAAEEIKLKLQRRNMSSSNPITFVKIVENNTITEDKRNDEEDDSSSGLGSAILGGIAGAILGGILGGGSDDDSGGSGDSGFGFGGGDSGGAGSDGDF